MNCQIKCLGILPILLIILTEAALYGQTDETDSKRRDLILSAKIFPSVTSNFAWYDFNEYSTDFQKRFTVSGGIELTKELKKNCFVETGLILYNWGFKETGTTEGDRELHSYKEQYIFLTIPIKGTYKHKRFFFGLGLNASYLLKNYQIRDNVLTVFSQIHHGTETKPIDKWLFGINANVGYEFKLTERLNFSADLYGISGHNFNVFRYSGLYSFGLGVGLDYKI